MSRLTGHRLGRYDLGEVLGQGYHGVVFRAHDRNSGVDVALKILSPDFPQNEKEVQRFSQVLSNWLALRHPHLVSVLGAGRTGPYCWIALELVEGESLAQVLRRFGSGPRDWKRAFRVALHIGRALQFTSGHRIVHSNITPQNILVRSADDTFKLNDTMLLKALQKSMLYRNALDQKQEAEAVYLSPEQVDGGASFVDHVCDLYSLGAVLYVMVTGQPLYQGATMEETLELIRAGAPTRPRKHQKSIPREFEWVILKMLARRQEDRYQRPTELLADLNRIAIKYRIPE
jgi:serine/threonine-protein kinase